MKNLILLFCFCTNFCFAQVVQPSPNPPVYSFQNVNYDIAISLYKMIYMEALDNNSTPVGAELILVNSIAQQIGVKGLTASTGKYSIANVPYKYVMKIASEALRLQIKEARMTISKFTSCAGVLKQIQTQNPNGLSQIVSINNISGFSPAELILIVNEYAPTN